MDAVPVAASAHGPSSIVRGGQLQVCTSLSDPSAAVGRHWRPAQVGRTTTYEPTGQPLIFQPLIPDFPATVDAVVAALRDCGHAVADGLVPADIVAGLHDEILSLDVDAFAPARVGRRLNRAPNDFVRRDEILWLQEQQENTAAYLGWMEQFRLAVNARLFLGLFDYECHFSRYKPGSFYRTHVDAFRGRSNRVLSTVMYLNPGWADSDGGELIIYGPDRRRPLRRICPEYGRFVVFLSEEFPHEVLPARRLRHSVAGWFRVNVTSTDRVDSPQ